MSGKLKKNLVLFMALTVLCLAAFPLEAAAGTKEVSVRYISRADGSDQTVSCLYRDSWFLETKSFQYAKKIVQVCAAGAASTYGKEGAARDFLESLGYRAFKSRYTGRSSEGTEEDNDNATYAFGVKTVRDGLGKTDLFAVILSGYSSSGYEWKSNFNLGHTRTHRGFYLAEQKVLQELKEYIKDHRKKGHAFRIWVTGHSRGGALANLLSHDLNLLYGSRKVLCYTFASPAVRRMSALAAKGDRNIFNLVNRADLVPYIPPLSMGYRRYGVTVPFLRSLYRIGKREVTALQVSERISFLTLLERLVPENGASFSVSDSLPEMVSGVIGDSRVRYAHTMEAYLSYVMGS